MSEMKYNPADANQITRRYLDSIQIEERLIDAGEASLQMELWGEKFDTPIMMPAFSHLKYGIKEIDNPMTAYAEAARNLNMVNFVGMIENPDIDEIFDTGAKTVRIVKPYADRDKVISQLLYAADHGAFGVGMDIDHIFGTDGHYDNVIGEPMTRQTSADLAEYIKTTKLPFTVKGVLSVRDAVKCAECGASAILISHHHGRMPFAIPPLRVLPEIVKEVGGPNGLKIFVDCGIDTGADAYKALALGADAVAVGRAILPELSRAGAAGVEEYVTKMNQELATIMNFTGVANVNAFDPGVLWM